MGFELVSRFRDDVRLRYFYTSEKIGKKGHPKQYDGVVDKKIYAKMSSKRRCTTGMDRK